MLDAITMLSFSLYFYRRICVCVRACKIHFYHSHDPVLGACNRLDLAIGFVDAFAVVRPRSFDAARAIRWNLGAFLHSDQAESTNIRLHFHSIRSLAKTSHTPNCHAQISAKHISISVEWSAFKVLHVAQGSIDELKISFNPVHFGLARVVFAGIGTHSHTQYDCSTNKMNVSGSIILCTAHPFKR